MDILSSTALCESPTEKLLTIVRWKQELAISVVKNYSEFLFILCYHTLVKRWQIPRFKTMIKIKVRVFSVYSI